MAKLVSISAVGSFDSTHLYAIDDQGKLWYREHQVGREDAWVQVPATFNTTVLKTKEVK